MFAAGLFIAWEGYTQRSNVWLLPLGIGLFIVHFGITVGLFKSIGVWVDFVNPAIVIGICSIFTLVYLSYIDLKERQHTLFQIYSELIGMYQQVIGEGKEQQVDSSDELERIRTNCHQFIEEFRQSHNKLKQQNQEKKDFFENFAHDAKKTLNRIITLDSNRHETPSPISEICHHLLKQINDILDMIRLEIGTEKIEKANVHLKRVISNVVENTALPEEGPEINLSIPETLPRIKVDEEKIRRVLQNLLDNALRHTPSEGLIEITVQEEDGIIVIKVRDTGSGIPPYHRDRILDKYFTTDPKGTGLGLPIAKEIIERHGGMISIESEAGRGSTFTFTLPKT
jgi:signal transduction histidine kinase